MRALVKYKQGYANMAIMDVPKPVPRPDEVLIRVKAVGICGTDIKIYDDKFDYNAPVIVGHEFSGIIEKTGDAVCEWQPGDRVVGEQHTCACGVCEFCLTGRRHLCLSKKAPGYGIDGAFAEYICLPSTLLHRIPECVSYEEAALIEPMAVAYHAVFRRVKYEPEDFIVILGSGPIALLTLQMVRAEGAAKIAITGLNADEKKRFDKARNYGADFLVNIQKEEPVERIMEVTGGRGADIVIDLTGSGMAINGGFSMLKKDGKFCALGLPGEDVAVPWRDLVLKAITFFYSYSSDYKSWEGCLSLIKNRRVNLVDFTDTIYPLEQWEEAFATARSGQALKVILKP